MVQVNDQSPNDDWYFVGNPSNPSPSDIEQHAFNIIGSPKGFTYNFTSDANVTFKNASVSGTSSSYRGRSTKSASSVKISAAWGSVDLGYVISKIKTMQFGSIDQKSPIYFDTGAAYGWNQYPITTVTDSEGVPIPAKYAVGDNEQFSNRNGFLNTWQSPKPKSGNIPYDGGGDGQMQDHFSITVNYIIILGNRVDAASPTPLPQSSQGATDIVFTINQQYRVGSQKSGDGLPITSHTVSFLRSGVSIQ